MGGRRRRAKPPNRDSFLRQILTGCGGFGFSGTCPCWDSQYRALYHANVLNQLAYLVVGPIHAVAEFRLGGFYRLSDGGDLASEFGLRGFYRLSKLRIPFLRQSGKFSDLAAQTIF